MTASPFFESRLPVGSSASRMDGDPGHGPSHGHTLLLTAGELAGEVLGAMRHLHALERGNHPLLPFGGPHAAVGEWQLDVLVDREIADQIEALEDEADLAVPHVRPLSHRQVLDASSVEQVLAAGRRIEQADDRQQRGLAAARRSGDGHILAARNLHADLGERVRFHLVRIEHLGDSLHVDDGVTHFFLPGGFAPADPLTRSLAGPQRPAPFARLTRSRSFAI